jgi:hypothetical protein
MDDRPTDPLAARTPTPTGVEPTRRPRWVRTLILVAVVLVAVVVVMLLVGGHGPGRHG